MYLSKDHIPYAEGAALLMGMVQLMYTSHEYKVYAEGTMQRAALYLVYSFEDCIPYPEGAGLLMRMVRLMYPSQEYLAYLDNAVQRATQYSMYLPEDHVASMADAAPRTTLHPMDPSEDFVTSMQDGVLVVGMLPSHEYEAYAECAAQRTTLRSMYLSKDRPCPMYLAEDYVASLEDGVLTFGVVPPAA